MVKDISEVVTIGDEYEFKIVSIDGKNHRLGLSIKALSETEKPAKEDKEPKDKEAKAEKTEKKASKKEEKTEEEK